MTVDEDFDQNLVLTQFSVESPALRVVAVPTFLSTPDGLVISSVVSKVNQPPTAPQLEVIFNVEYSTVDSLQIPSRVVNTIKNVGVFEIGLSGCQVFTTEVTSPKSDVVRPEQMKR
jgi:hypothetical protein